MSDTGEIIQEAASDVSTIATAWEATKASLHAEYADYLSGSMEGTNQTANVTISTVDYRKNAADNVAVVGTSGNDNFSNYKGNNVTIFGEAGNDDIASLEGRVTIFAGAGNDTITHIEGSGFISGGDGNDRIDIGYFDNFTVRGGKGDDVIFCTNVGEGGVDRNDHVSYQYANGDGNDTIWGWNAGSTLFVEGNYSISPSQGYTFDDYRAGDCTWDEYLADLSNNDYDRIVYVGSGSITLKYMGSKTFEDYIHVVTVPAGTFSASSEPVAPRVSVSGGSATSVSGGGSATSVSGGGSPATVSGGGSATTVTGGGSATSVSGGGSATSVSGGGSSASVTGGDTSPATPTPTVTASQNIYTGGNQVISNYGGQAVTLGAFTGASFSGNNFLVNSATGTLTIENVTDKIIDLRDGTGGEFLKAYTPSTAGVIDGRGINCYEIINGSSAGTDVIFAGDGGSQLWGGSGLDADFLVGGNGTDLFVVGRFQGDDTIINAASSDIVNLTDATLSDIIAAVEVDGNIALVFNTGNVLTIQSTELLSAAITLADGSSWRFNHSTQAWQSA